jgi:hypothetical protein
MREGDIIAKQFWGDIIANLLHKTFVGLTSFRSRIRLPPPRLNSILTKPGQPGPSFEVGECSNGLPKSPRYCFV